LVFFTLFIEDLSHSHFDLKFCFPDYLVGSALILSPVAGAIVLLVKCRRRRLAEKKDETQSKTDI